MEYRKILVFLHCDFETKIQNKLKQQTKNLKIMETINDVKRIVAVLTADEQQLLKDTIIKGSWGDCEREFLRYPAATGSDNLETVYATGYCTNDAHLAGHFQGRIVSTMFRSIYKKMCSYNRNQIGHIICHCNDWWGDGTGDMLFIRDGWDRVFEEWAKEN